VIATITFIIDAAKIITKMIVGNKNNKKNAYSMIFILFRQ